MTIRSFVRSVVLGVLGCLDERLRLQCSCLSNVGNA